MKNDICGQNAFLWKIWEKCQFWSKKVIILVNKMIFQWSRSKMNLKNTHFDQNLWFFRKKLRQNGWIWSEIISLLWNSPIYWPPQTSLIVGYGMGMDFLVKVEPNPGQLNMIMVRLNSDRSFFSRFLEESWRSWKSWQSSS